MVFNKTTPADVAKFYTAHDIQKRRGMHTLTGPVYIEGAEPGDVLEIRILDIKLSDWGYNFLSPTQGIFSEFTKPRIKYFKFDKKNKTTEFSKGVCLHLKPFPGIIAVAPPIGLAAMAGRSIYKTPTMGQPATGEFNSVPPGPFGGNFDQPELQVGFDPFRTRIPKRRAWYGRAIRTRCRAMAKSTSQPWKPPMNRLPSSFSFGKI